MPLSNVYIRTYTKDFGVITTAKAVYVVYGKTLAGDKAGTGLLPHRKFYFRIKDLVEDHPDLQNPQVDKAIMKQERLIKKFLCKGNT